MKFYAGIGSRKTPKDTIDLFESIAYDLALSGYILRSGHADGADMAFENGVNKANGNAEIYLPWPGFNGSTSNKYNITKEAYELAEKYHPNWKRLKPPGMKLIARNGYQVLGEDLKTPVDFIICWTEGGRDVGGTSQTLRIAKDYKINIYNFGKKEDIDRFYKEIL